MAMKSITHKGVPMSIPPVPSSHPYDRIEEVPVTDIEPKDIVAVAVGMEPTEVFAVRPNEDRGEVYLDLVTGHTCRVDNTDKVRIFLED